VSAPAIIHGLDSVPERLRGAAVAVDAFDGVHLGHQAMLYALASEARSIARPAIVVTSGEVVAKHPRLTPLPEKSRLLGTLGVDAVVGVIAEEGPFGSRKLAMRVMHALDPVAVVVAPEHAASFMGPNLGHVRLPELPPSDPARPARIVHALREGDVSAANADLGYRWFVLGEVIHGDKRGRELGFPTANIAPPPSTPLRHGIYAVHVRHRGKRLDGVANFGVRPTFATTAGPLLEVFLFDFAGNLYGETLEVSFLAWIRPEARFDSVDALVARIREDEFAARAILASAGPGSALDQTLVAEHS
jgi:riboflavin kinase/FMN adenylyltransferase